MSENKESLCFGKMVQLLLQYHKHKNSLNISAFVHPLPAKKRRSKVLGPDFFKSHAFPHIKNFKYNQNTPEKKKCRTFSRYSDWLYWAMFLVILEFGFMGIAASDVDLLPVLVL
jgi:hypothetical protein